MKKPQMRIISLDGLVEKIGLSRGRVGQLIREGRIQADVIDDLGRCFWTEEHAAEIATKIKEQKASRKLGRGNRIEIDPSEER